MSVFNSERYMRFRQVITGATLTESKPCRKCGYDLRGLLASKNCPECGTPIARTVMSRSRDDVLANAPIAYLARLRVGALMLLISPLCLAGLVALGPLIGNARPGRLAVLTGLLLVGLLWTLGCGFIASPRPGPRSETIDRKVWSHRRRLLRMSAIVWTIAPACVLILTTATNLTPLLERILELATLISLCLGIVNTTVLSHYLSLLTAWAYDLELARSFERLIWGIASGITLAVTHLLVMGSATLSLRSLALFFFTALLWLIWVLAMFYVLAKLVEMRSLFAWAHRNARSRLDYYARQSRGETGATSPSTNHSSERRADRH